MVTSLEGCDFELLRRLFLVKLKWARNDAADVSREIKKEYRKLSIRYHPDKHADDEECYKVAFQALNDAYERVQSTF